MFTDEHEEVLGDVGGDILVVWGIEPNDLSFPCSWPAHDFGEFELWGEVAFTECIFVDGFGLIKHGRVAGQ